MNTPYEIPLKPESQEFDISLAGVTYHIKLRWCPPNNSWILYVMDSNQNPILSGIPLITGADLLEQFAYLEIGGKLIVQSDFDPTLVPNYASLGNTGHLFLVTP